jgi:hypothetical protein
MYPQQHQQKTANPWLSYNQLIKKHANDLSLHLPGRMNLHDDVYHSNLLQFQSRGFTQHDLNYMPSSKEFLDLNPS